MVVLMVVTVVAFKYYNKDWIVSLAANLFQHTTILFKRLYFLLLNLFPALSKRMEDKEQTIFSYDDFIGLFRK